MRADTEEKVPRQVAALQEERTLLLARCNQAGVPVQLSIKRLQFCYCPGRGVKRCDKCCPGAVGRKKCKSME